MNARKTPRKEVAEEGSFGPSTDSSGRKGVSKQPAKTVAKHGGSRTPRLLRIPWHAKGVETTKTAFESLQPYFTEAGDRGLQPDSVEAADSYSKDPRKQQAGQFSADKREIGELTTGLRIRQDVTLAEDFGLFLEDVLPEDTRHPWSKVRGRS